MFTKGQLHLICTIFIVFLLYDNKTCGKGIIGFIGNVQNLSVQAVVDESYFKDNDTYKSVKLNVSWLPPDSDRQPTSYSIIITNIPKEYNDDKVECPDESLYYTTKNSNEHSALLPQTHFLSDMSEMHVRPNCLYKIEVFANPRMKPTHKSEVNYTVPECVGGKCSCINAKLMLPVPQVNVIQYSQTIFVKWNITSDDSHINSYVISIGIPLLTSKAGLPVYNITRIGTTSAQEMNFMWNLKNSDELIKLKSGYKILVSAMDLYGCLGIEGGYLINIPELHENSENANSWLLMLGILGFFSAFGILTVTWFYHKKKCRFIQKNRSNTRMLTASTIVKCKSQWAASVLQKQNVLYVEQVTEDTIYKNDNDDFEVSYKSVQLIHELGKGQFGRVYLGRLNEDVGALVAVKMTQCFEMFDTSEAQQQFMEEINIMKAAGPHPHLVSLIGYCTKPDKPMCIILEYMEGGDLLAYLHSIKHNYHNGSITRNKRSLSQETGHSTSDTVYTTISSRLSTSTCTTSTKFFTQYTGETNIQENEQFPLKYVNISECYETDKYENLGKMSFSKISQERFIKFALDIAKGMKHLETKRITHRDLAARNILLASDLTLKISDFGLSRNGVYVINNSKGKARHLPIRWMSPEALRDRAFSSKSDVWSFAIVLWEIGTLGSFPYSNIRDDQLLQHVINNKIRLEKPDGVCSNIYDIMKLCWSPELTDRPSFAELVSVLQNLQESSDNATSNPCYTLLSQL